MYYFLVFFNPRLHCRRNVDQLYLRRSNVSAVSNVYGLRGLARRDDGGGLYSQGALTLLVIAVHLLTRWRVRGGEDKVNTTCTEGERCRTTSNLWIVTPEIFDKTTSS